MSALSETVQTICLYPPPPPAVSNAGSINIQNSSIEAVGNGSERIALWGGDTIINNSQIHLFNESASDANPAKFLDIHSYSLNIDHADVATEAHNSGKGADIKVQSTVGMSVLNDSFIESRTFKEAVAGNVTVDVGENLNIHGLAKWPAIMTGIRSVTQLDSTGNAGNVTVNVQGNIDIAEGAGIHSRTQSLGNSGTVQVTSGGTITLLGGLYDTDTTANGKTSTIDTSARSFSNTKPNSEVIKGNAGTTVVKAKEINMFGKTQISALAFPGANNSGDVTITADNIKLDGHTSTSLATLVPVITSTTIGRGDAGKVTVNAGNLSIMHGYVNADSIFTGNAGSVTITADSITVDGLGVPRNDLGIDYSTISAVSVSGVDSVTHEQSQSSGNAGGITIHAGKLDVVNGGTIDTSTFFSIGKAGTITIDAKTVNASNKSLIVSEAWGENSSGQPGNIIITASDWIHLSDGARIGTENEAVLPTSAKAAKITPHFITIAAPEIILKDSTISTSSIGNVAAGNININFTNSLKLDPSFIKTTANTGNGGDIFINGSNGTIFLDNSGFLTSVSGGVNSHGGDINVTAGTLIMNNGVIQANAVGGTGGDINLNLKALIPSQNSLIKGGSRVDWQPFIAGFNVIQAASETGVNGSVNVTSPQFDISGSISGLKTAKLELPNIDKMPCQGSTNPASHLVRGSKGGIPVSEVKAGFIPSASVLSNAESGSDNNLSSAKSLNANAIKLAKNHPCAAHPL